VHSGRPGEAGLSNDAGNRGDVRCRNMLLLPSYLNHQALATCPNGAHTHVPFLNTFVTPGCGLLATLCSLSTATNWKPSTPSNISGEPPLPPAAAGLPSTTASRRLANAGPSSLECSPKRAPRSVLLAYSTRPLLNRLSYMAARHGPSPNR